MPLERVLSSPCMYLIMGKASCWDTFSFIIRTQPGKAEVFVLKSSMCFHLKEEKGLDPLC